MCACPHTPRVESVDGSPAPPGLRPRPRRRPRAPRRGAASRRSARARASAEDVPGTARVDSVKDIRLPSVAGPEVALSDHRQAQALVLCWTAPGCPVAEVQAPRLKALAEAWQARGVTFLGVSSDAGTPLERLKEHVAKHAWAFPVLRDEQGLLAQRVGAKTTTTVVLLDRHRRVRYRGALDDQYGVTGRKPAPTREHLVDGARGGARGEGRERRGDAGARLPDHLRGAAPPRAPTLHLERRGRGASCTSAAQAATARARPRPFPLLRYADVAGRTAVLREVIEQGRMPPWTAEGPVGHVRRTIAASRPRRGAPCSTGSRAARPRATREGPGPPGPPTVDGWEIGTPDLVLAFPKAEPVPGRGRRALPLRRGADEPDGGPLGRGERGPPRRAAGGAPRARAGRARGAPRRGVARSSRTWASSPRWCPGGRSVVYPAGMAKKLPEGQPALLPDALHAQRRGHRGRDAHRAPLREGGARARGEDGGGVPVRARHPARAIRRYEASAMVPVPFDAKVLAYMPHMHLRGKSFRYEVVDLVDKDEGARAALRGEALRLQLADALPARGAAARARRDGRDAQVHGHVRQLLRRTPTTPTRRRTVRWGDQTWDEMMIGYVDYIQVGPPTARSPRVPTPGRGGTASSVTRPCRALRSAAAHDDRMTPAWGSGDGPARRMGASQEVPMRPPTLSLRAAAARRWLSRCPHRSSRAGPARSPRMRPPGPRARRGGGRGGALRRRAALRGAWAARPRGGASQASRRACSCARWSPCCAGASRRRSGRGSCRARRRRPRRARVRS